MKSIKIPCPNPNCRSVFAWKKNLISHLRYQCGQQPRFKCPYCDYLCKIKTDVRYPWYSYCPWNVRPYQCLNCPNNYAKKSHLKRHVMSACNGKEPRYRCPYCMYISRYPSDTYKHVKRLHENQDVYAIDVLGTTNYYSKSTVTQDNKILQSKLDEWSQNIPSLT
ncbi:PREDICTED: RE1-silencing transcription factor B-like [Atta colombica]|nr:PREDICTED: RE1-silencing transcription factor B-like [Atta colombica]